MPVLYVFLQLFFSLTDEQYLLCMYSLNQVTVITLFDLKDNQQVQFGSRPRTISDYSGTQETESLTEHPDDGLPAAVGPLLGGAHAAHCGVVS